MSLNEGMFKKILQTVHDKLEKEGGAAGFDDLAKEVKKEFGITISKDTLKNMPGVKQHRDGDYILEADLKEAALPKDKQSSILNVVKKEIPKAYFFAMQLVVPMGQLNKAKELIKKANLGYGGPHGMDGSLITQEQMEADLSKSQITKVHKQADDLPKKDFMKRYGKDGDAVRYATATNMVKKKLGIGEDNKLIKKGELKMNESYKLKLNSAMEHYKIDSLAELKDEDQKAFFSYVDSLEEGLSAGQKKLPPALQKAILAKQGKKETANKDEMHDAGKKDDKKEIKEEDAYDKDEMMKAEMMKKEMMKKVEMMKAETDPAKMQEMKKEMMTAMKDMPEMMKKEMMKKMEMAMASEEVKEMKEPMNAMMMKAMKMPIRAMKKTEDLVGGQKKLDKDKDGDLDAKDFAALRKTKSEAVKTGEADAEPKMKDLNAMVKSSHKPDHKGNPIDDMNAGYMASNVKAPVMNKGGADMAKVKDAPNMKDAMKKINATYGMKKENNGRYLQTKPGSLEEAVLKSRGLVK